MFDYFFRFGDILKSTDHRNMDKLCSSLLSTKQLNAPAIIHGKTYEDVAIQQFQSVQDV